MAFGKDDLVASKESIAAEAQSFASSVDFGAESQAVESAEDSLVVPGGIHDDDETEPFFDGQKAPEQDEPVAGEPAASGPKPSQTIKFRANGEDIELSMEEAQKRLSLAEGARQALADRAKLRKEAANKDKAIQDLTRYKETWDKLESIKHDKKQLLKLITGEEYDDFIQRELEKREIYQYGTDDQKRVLEQQERIAELERRQALEEANRQAQIEKAEQSSREAERQRIATAMEREYFKFEMPADMDPAEQEVLKDMLWSKSARDLKRYQEKYGKITNKMVEKAFADNAAALLRTKSAQVDKTVQKIRDDERKSAKEKAQIASTRNVDQGVPPEVYGMDPKALFNFFKKGKN